MKTSFKTLSFIFFIPLLLLIYPLHSQAEEESSTQTKDIQKSTDNEVENWEKIISKGVGALSSKSESTARDDAIKSAIMNAVAKAVGTIVSSQSVESNYTLLEERIFSKASDYLKSYKILDEYKDGDFYYVKIEAQVDLDSILDDLQGIGLLMQRQPMEMESEPKSSQEPIVSEKQEREESEKKKLQEETGERKAVGVGRSRGSVGMGRSRGLVGGIGNVAERLEKVPKVQMEKPQVQFELKQAESKLESIQEPIEALVREGQEKRLEELRPEREEEERKRSAAPEMKQRKEEEREILKLESLPLIKQLEKSLAMKKLEPEQLEREEQIRAEPEMKKPQEEEGKRNKTIWMEQYRGVGSPNQEDRRNAVESLGKLGNQAVPELIPPLKDEDSDVRDSVEVDDAFMQIKLILAKMKEANIVFNTPPSMNLKEKAEIQLVLSLMKQIKELEQLIVAPGEKESAIIKVYNSTEARLTSTDFEINAITPEELAVEPSGVSEWRWEIKPKRTGLLSLHLTLSAVFNIEGNKTRKVIRVFDKTIEVEVTGWQTVSTFVKQNWQWLWTIIVVPVAGWLLNRWRKRRNATTTG